MSPYVGSRFGDPAVERVMAAGRAAFAASLSGHGLGPDGSELSVVHTRLRTDRPRAIVCSPGGPEYWRDGSVDAAGQLGGLFLGLFVGADRYLDAEQFVMLLAEATRSTSGLAVSEPVAAIFTNLAIVEGWHRAGHEVIIWAMVARELATASAHRDLHALLPGLVTASDPLERTSADLDSDDDAFTRAAAALLDDILPASRGRLEHAVDARSRRAAIADHENELWDYVRTHLVSRVAAQT